MTDVQFMIIIGFVVFFVSALVGRYVGDESRPKSILERKTIDSLKANQTNLENTIKKYDADLAAAKKSLCEKQKEIERLKDELKNKQPSASSQTDAQIKLSECERKLKDLEQKLGKAIQIHPDLQTLLESSAEPLVPVNQVDAVAKIRTGNLQAALDKYIQSTDKTMWQIGRDYELYVGQKYISKGYSVEFYGITHGFDDRGIDLIARNKMHTLFIQCKYWSQSKVIHENAIHQFYGSTIGFCREKGIPVDSAVPVFVTNITLTEQAKDTSSTLGVQLVQRFKMEEFPRVKCCMQVVNGSPKKVYFLPFDKNYDWVMPTSPGEMFTWTVQEAESLGFKRL